MWDAVGLEGAVELRPTLIGTSEPQKKMGGEHKCSPPNEVRNG